MPLYDYLCEHCGHVEENVLQKFDDLPLNCQCGDPNNTQPLPMIRQIGQSTFQLKGNDWPDKESKILKERFEKRNKRIEKLDPLAQQRLKNIIDSTGGKRYIPAIWLMISVITHAIFL